MSDTEHIDNLDRLLNDRRVAEADRRQDAALVKASDRLLEERRKRDRRRADR